LKVSQGPCQLLALGEVWLVPLAGVARGHNPQPVPDGSPKTWHHTMGVSGAPHRTDTARAYHRLFAVDDLSWEEPGEPGVPGEHQWGLASSASAWARVAPQQPCRRLRNLFVLVMGLCGSAPMCFTLNPGTSLGASVPEGVCRCEVCAGHGADVPGSQLPCVQV